VFVIAITVGIVLFPIAPPHRVTFSTNPPFSKGAWGEVSRSTPSQPALAGSDFQVESLDLPEATVPTTSITDQNAVATRSEASLSMLRVSERSVDPPSSLLLLACGDLMLRAVPSGALDEIQPLLQEAEFRVGNLECVLTQRGTPVPQKPFTFRDPNGLAILQKAGIDLVSLANNHSWDYQWDGMEDTFRSLDQAGIKTVGFANPTHSASIVVEKKGIRVAFLAFAEADLLWKPFWFQEGVGIPLVEESPMVEAVSSAKAGGVDHVVVFLHWGEEGSTRALASQKELAHRLVDAGASLILGSHSHTAQEVETYRGAVIAYSLGDCLFGSSTSEDCGQLLEVCLDPKGSLQWCKIVGLTMREGVLSATWIRQLETRNNVR